MVDNFILSEAFKRAKRVLSNPNTTQSAKSKARDVLKKLKKGNR